MGIFLNSNIASIGAQRNLFNTTNSLNQSLERLSSGLKINHASDGAAALVTSNILEAQVRGSAVGQSNVQQGLSMLQTADSALQQIQAHLQNLNELAVGGASQTFTSFTALTSEVAATFSAITRIASNTYFGSANNLLDGSLNGAAFNIQAGANATDTIDISAAFAIATAGSLGLSTSAIASNANATTLISEVKTALNNLGSQLATIGGLENTMQNQSNYLSVLNQNMSAAVSNIRNTDVAQEMSNTTRLQVTQQAGAFALAQANSMPSIALKLLQ